MTDKAYARNTAVAFLFLLCGCDSALNPATDPGNYKRVIVEGMPCIVYSRYQPLNNAVGGISCDWEWAKGGVTMSSAEYSDLLSRANVNDKLYEVGDRAFCAALEKLHSEDVK